MRLLLDECVPKPLLLELTGYDAVLAGARGRIRAIPSTKGAKTPLTVLIVIGFVREARS